MPQENEPLTRKENSMFTSNQEGRGPCTLAGSVHLGLLPMLLFIILCHCALYRPRRERLSGDPSPTPFWRPPPKTDHSASEQTAVLVLTAGLTQRAWEARVGWLWPCPHSQEQSSQEQQPPAPLREPGQVSAAEE